MEFSDPINNLSENFLIEWIAKFLPFLDKTPEACINLIWEEENGLYSAPLTINPSEQPSTDQQSTDQESTDQWSQSDLMPTSEYLKWLENI